MLRFSLHPVFYMMLLCCLLPATLSAKGIDINDVDIVKTDQTWLLNAKINYRLSDEILKALKHGVALYFHIDIETEKRRRWFWNKKIEQNKLAYRLQYHPLSQRYLLTDYYDFQHHDYRTLTAALNKMGDIKNVPILNKFEDIENTSLTARVRAFLDNSSLPAPLRPLSFISSDWQLSSDWHVQALQP